MPGEPEKRSMISPVKNDTTSRSHDGIPAGRIRIIKT
jgi:hypothetical protein